MGNILLASNEFSIFFLFRVGAIRGSRVAVNECLMNMSDGNYNSARMQSCLETTSNKKM